MSAAAAGGSVRQSLLTVEVRANLAMLGPKYGKHLSAIRAPLSGADPAS